MSTDILGTLTSLSGSSASKSFTSTIKQSVGDAPLSTINQIANLENNLGGSMDTLSNIAKDVITSQSKTTTPGTSNDFRVRIRAQTGQDTKIYGAQGDTNILNPLYETNGLIFPYTPQIEWTQAVNYEPISLTHSNQDYYSYKNTPSTSLRITGEFTVTNYREGQYLLAAIHLLRTISKMYFGEQTWRSPQQVASDPSNPSLSGLPPPIMLLSGYGNYMFNDLPVIVKDHGYSFPKDVDYINVNTAGGMARLPVVMTISTTLIVQNTPKKLRTEFNLDEFRTGALMKNKTGWI